MRACSTGVFGSCLLLCAPTIGAVRGGGAKNCALEKGARRRLATVIHWLRRDSEMMVRGSDIEAASFLATLTLRRGCGVIIRFDRSRSL
jgi:hypothetical protein